MSLRKIITIDEEKCTGCGLCIPNCPEGALQIIDNKARLVSDLFCDGLGACIGHCPEGAITIEEREAIPYDESKVMGNIVKQGKNTIIAHLRHLKDHNEIELLREALDFLKQKEIILPESELKFLVDMNTGNTISTNENDNISKVSTKDNSRISEEKTLRENKVDEKFCGCPSAQVLDFTEKESLSEVTIREKFLPKSQLRHWPIQIMLVPTTAPYLKNAEIVIAADCVPFSYANFHEDFLKGKVLLIGCPKLDDAEFYKNKLTEIFEQNNIKSVTSVHMEVPCCFGLTNLIKAAINDSGKEIVFDDVTITIKGNLK